MVYLVHHRNTSLRHTNWMVKVCESCSTSRFIAALNDSAKALAALVPMSPIDCVTQVLHRFLEGLRGINTAVAGVKHWPFKAASLALAAVRTS